MFSDKDWMCIGEVVAAQGLRGELRIKPYSEFPERFLQPGKRWIKKRDTKPIEVNLISGRQLPGKSLFIVKFSGIGNRTEAENQVGTFILVKTSNRPKLLSGEVHFLDLLGLEARLSSNGHSIGVVTDLIKGGNDLLEIKLFKGKKVLIPFVKEIIPEVKIQEGSIIINPPPGLLDL